jgi:hypothetical protein
VHNKESMQMRSTLLISGDFVVGKKYLYIFKCI